MEEFARAEPDVEVVWRAFELRPEPVPTLDPAGEYLRRVWSSSVYPLAERAGIPIKLPPVQPRSRGAHEAAQWARAAGRFDDYNAAVFRAFFERGENIGEIEVLTALAAQLTMDGAALRAALESGLYTSLVLEDERGAQRLRISGVPAFVVDRGVALSGMQPVENLQDLVAHARTRA